MSPGYRGETKAIEYAIGGLCAWHIFSASIYGVLQVLGFHVSLGWASFIGLITTVVALVKIRKDERPRLRALPQEGPLAGLFAHEGGAAQPPTVSPLAQVPEASLPSDAPSSGARTELKRKVSTPDYFAGVFSVWILVMALNAIVVSGIAWASLIALGITLWALVMIHRRESQPLRSLPTVGPLAQLPAKETRDQHVG